MNPLQKEIDSLPNMFQSREVVLVGCSGGADSKSLVGMLLESPLNLKVVIGHIDHGLRPESEEDSKQVREFASNLNLVCVSTRLELPKTDEFTARVARHKALEKMAKIVRADKIVLAHNANDQLETLLMRLCRGTGLVGLCGMEKVSRIIRPLLETPRSTIDEYMRYRGWTPVEDSSNSTDVYFRNRVRHHLVPLLEKENPRVVEVVSNTAHTLKDELSIISYYENLEWAKVFSGGVLDIEALKVLPRPMAARLVIRFWKEHVKNKHKQLSRKHVLSILSVLFTDAGGQTVQFPGGLKAKKQKGKLHALL